MEEKLIQRLKGLRAGIRLERNQKENIRQNLKKAIGKEGEDKTDREPAIPKNRGEKEKMKYSVF